MCVCVFASYRFHDNRSIGGREIEREERQTQRERERE